MNKLIYRVAAPLAAILSIGVLAGCGGISDLTKERVARAETAVRQAQQTVGNSENGALELQRARDNLQRAREAMNDQDAMHAERYAQQAQLDGELAVAKSQSAAARHAADELRASIQTLRREAGLSSTPQQPAQDEQNDASRQNDFPPR